MTEPNISAVVSSLSSKSNTVHNLSLQSRIDLVDELLTSIQTEKWSTAGNWVREELSLLGYCNSTSEVSAIAKTLGASKRSAVGIFPIMYLNTLKKSLKYQLALLENKEDVVKPEILSKVSTYRTDQGDVNIHGPLSLPGLPFHTAEVWTDPTKSTNHIHEHKKDEDDGVCLVLGAGNQAALTIIDTFQCFFLHPRKPILIKQHPLRPYQMEPFSLILKPLIEKGYLQMILDGGIPQTKEILDNPKTVHVHITGAYGTAEAIKKTLASTRPHLSKREVSDLITSELGCATPWIFTPASYTEKELKNAAIHIVSSKKVDGGCNCLSAQVIILPEKWGQKDKFRTILKEELQRTTTDPCYYPGSAARCTEMAKHYEKKGKGKVTKVAAEFTNSSAQNVQNCPDMQPVLVECGLYGKEDYDGLALTKEAFGPLLSIVELPGGDNAEEYLLKTVAPFVNDKSNIFGSLCCSVLIPDGIENVKQLQRSVVASLKYGSIAVNCWSIMAYSFMCVGGLWCGHGREENQQSGNGYVGNHFLIPNLEKTVVYSSMSNTPLLDKKSLPPAIVSDAMTEFFMGKSMLSGFIKMMILLFIRFWSTILPIQKVLGWKHPYGGSV